MRVMSCFACAQRVGLPQPYGTECSGADTGGATLWGFLSVFRHSRRRWVTAALVAVGCMAAPTLPGHASPIGPEIFISSQVSAPYVGAVNPFDDPGFETDGVTPLGPGENGSMDDASTDPPYEPDTRCPETGAISPASDRVAARAAVDTLDDAWRSHAEASIGPGATIVSQGLVPAAVNSPDVISFPGTPVTATVTRRRIPVADVPATGPTGPLTVSGGTPSGGVTHPAADTLQDCAPRPASLYDTTAQPPYWNAVTFENTDIDGALFEFNMDVTAFGAWFGDLETRTDGRGKTAWVSLYDASGALIGSPEAVAPEALNGNQKLCGGPDQEDDPAVGCGNQSTRWIGFSGNQAVRFMLITVGDDDSCEEKDVTNNAQNCNGRTEFLSFIGPTVAFPQPQLTVRKQVVLADGSSGTQVEGWTFGVSVDGGAADTEATTDSGVVAFDLPTTSGALTLSESSKPGWSLASLTCTVDLDDDPTTPGAALSLNAGPALAYSFRLDSAMLFHNIDCTATNRQAPTTVTLAKIEHAGGESTEGEGWQFIVTAGGQTSLDLITGATGSGSVTVPLTTPTDLTVTETASPGWNLTGVTCSVTPPGLAATTMPADPVNGSFTLPNVAPGSAVDCTVDNTADTALTVVKETLVNGVRTAEPGWAFDVTAGASSGSVLTGPDGSGSLSFAHADPVDIKLREIAQSGWMATDLTCQITTQDGTTSAPTIEVSTGLWTITGILPGSVLTCRATNEPASIAIDKTGPTTVVNTGATVTFPITVTNTGAVAATDVTLTDTLPAGLTAISVTTSDWHCAITTPAVVTCALPSPLPPGAEAPVVTVVALVGNSPGDYTNSATVSSSSGTATDTHSFTAETPAPVVPLPETGSDPSTAINVAFRLIGLGVALALVGRLSTRRRARS